MVTSDVEGAVVSGFGAGADVHAATASTATCAEIQAVATPRRDIGASTLEKLATAARGRNLPLSKAAGSAALLATLAPRAARALQGFSERLDHWRKLSSSVKWRH